MGTRRHFRNRLFGGALLAAVAVAGVAGAAPIDRPDPFADLQPVGDSDLKAERGGFSFHGISFDIGVQIVDTLNGAPALVSTLDLTPQGLTISGNAGVITSQEVTELSSATGVNLQGLVGATGVIEQENGGVTALVANITPQLLQNLVINTASNQVINQQTNITVTLPGFQQTMAQASQASLTSQLGSLLGQVQQGAIGH